MYIYIKLNSLHFKVHGHILKFDVAFVINYFL